MSRDFTWEDAGRTVLLRSGGLAAAPELLAANGFAEFELLSTERALAEPAAAALVSAAAGVHEVGAGQVPDLAGELLERLPERRLPLVALGGGRVIDVVKALAAIREVPAAAIPTTMSGAEMTAIHRMPSGPAGETSRRTRPSLVIADPVAMTSQPEARLRASSMNALAHGADCLYTPRVNPVATMAALRGAGEIAVALDQIPEERDRAGLASGSLLCGYAIDSAGFGLHHVVCQTLVRLCDTPHAETNARILPAAALFLATRAPSEIDELALAIGADLEHLEARLLDLGGNPARLGALAGAPENRERAVAAMLRRPELGNVPGEIDEEDLEGLLRSAW